MTIEEQPTTIIEIGQLIGRVEEFHREGYRLVQIGCTKVDEDSFEINYCFDKDNSFQNIRIIVSQETEVPSISSIYWGAFIYENEMHDFFGIRARGMNIDYQGNLIRTATKYPFTVTTFKGDGPCQNR